MLTLTRYARQRVCVGDDIVVEVLEIRHNMVRLGFTAPDAVRIDREEIRERQNRGEKQPLYKAKINGKWVVFTKGGSHAADHNRPAQIHARLPDGSMKWIDEDDVFLAGDDQ